MVGESGLIAVVIGASTYWHPDCVREGRADPECRVEEEQLQHADDDARRVGFALEAALGAGRVGVFTTDVDSALLGPDPVGGAALADVEAWLRTAPEADGVVLYVSSHGTASAVHLDDRAHPLAVLRTAIEAAAGAPVALLITDACYSARWKGDGGAAPDLRWPPVDPARGVELVVDSKTPEEPGLRGGAFTRLVLAGLLGAADADGDGTVAQELSDHVHAYGTSLAHAFVPTVRAPDARTQVPDVRGPARVVLRDDDGEARWMVDAIARDGGEVPFTEASTLPGSERTLALPAGRWVVWHLVHPGDWVAQRLQEYVALRCELTLAPGDTADVGVCPQKEYRLRSSKGGVEDPTAAPNPTPLAPEVVLDLLQAWPTAVPDAPPSGSDRWFGGSRVTVVAGAAGETGLLSRGGGLVGPVLELVRSSDRGRGHLLAAVSGGVELGAGEPSRATALSVSIGTDQALFARPAFRLGGVLRGGVGGVLLSADGARTGTVTPVLDLGISATVAAGAWQWRTELAAAPRQPFVLPALGDLVGAPELGRGLVWVGVGRHW